MIFLITVLLLAYMHGHEDITRRFSTVYPENSTFFASSSAVTKLLLASDLALMELKERVAGVESYIVGGQLTLSDYILSSRLKTPLFAPSYELFQELSKLDRNRLLFKELDLSVPFHADNLADKNTFLMETSKLLLTHLLVRRWLFKLGHTSKYFQDVAYVDRADLEEDLACMDTKSLVLNLPKLLAKHMVLTYPEASGNVEHFIELLVRSGGSIEAAPLPLLSEDERTLSSAHFTYPPHIFMHVFMDPEGKITMRGSTDYVFQSVNKPLLEFIPQGSHAYSELKQTTLKICQRLYEKGMIGYLSIEFVSVTIGSEQKLWVLRLHPYFTPQHANCDYLSCIADSKFDEESGKLLHDYNEARRRAMQYLPQARFFDRSHIDQPRYEERHAVFCASIKHENFAFITHQVFTSLVQTVGVAFDVNVSLTLIILLIRLASYWVTFNTF